MDPGTKQSRIVIIDDQRSFADALELAVSLSDDMRVVGKAADAEAGFALVNSELPHLVVIDFRLVGGVDGLDLAKRIRTAYAHAQLTIDPAILILTAFVAPQVIRRAKELRGVSVLSKNLPMSLIVTSFGGAIRGEPMADQVAAGSNAGLTVAELEVLELLGQGRQAAQIAEELYLSVHAIRARIKTMLRKLDVNSQLEAVATATRLGLIVPPILGDDQSTE